MTSASEKLRANCWLFDNGPRELERLFQTIVHDTSSPSAAKLVPARLLIVPKASSSPMRHALFLLDDCGNIVIWYEGAEQLYGYSSVQVIGRPVSILYPPQGQLRQQLKTAERCGHACDEDWSVKRGGARFWANVITIALRDERGILHGYASVVRQFSEPGPNEPGRDGLGVVSIELDATPEANDTFLNMIGYSREDLQAGLLPWPDLTPPEYLPQDETAHEEGLRYGACTPFEKELICKDGTRVPVQVVAAVLGLSPFRSIILVRDLRKSDTRTSTSEEPAALIEGFGEFVGRSSPMKQMFRQVEAVAPTNATVLIMGETGTGKELVARAVHRLSPRRERPFITLNCAAIPTGLLESELFGYERGAFTGALAQKIGRFELAHRGTLFLDEIGDVPLDLQPKLLRALQEKSFERLGGTKTIPIDVRLIAATNRDLTQMMADKLFRTDLYYRLKVFPITTRPLRERPEDIVSLAKHFLQKFARQMDKHIDHIPAETMRAFVAWSWPGNVRELENLIERSVILSKGPDLRVPLEEIRSQNAGSSSGSTLEQVERDHIVRVLRETGCVVSKAANRLGMPRTTLNAMMRKLGISRNSLDLMSTL